MPAVCEDEISLYRENATETNLRNTHFRIFDKFFGVKILPQKLRKNMSAVCDVEISLLSRKLQPITCAQGSPASPGTTRTRSNRFSTWSWWADTTTAATHVGLTRYTANEGPVK